MHTDRQYRLKFFDNLRDVSKIESGRLELERRPFELARVIEQGFDMLGESARAKRIDLLYEIADDVPAHVYGDPACLRQIIVNLAGNAVKFTGAGEVLVQARLQPDATDRPPMLEFRVSDTGIGIPADRLNVLFRPFTQVDASPTRKYGGTGLGLAICKRLTELMGGRIAVESEPGRGSMFTFTIRCEPAPPPPGTDAATGLDALAGRRILIVDDNASNLRILEHQLRRWGLRAQVAPGARAALDLLARGEAFDAAIVDNQMPEMDGVALAQAIRKRAAHADLPVILLSFSAHRGAKGANPFVAQLLKPTRQSQLFDALVTALTGKRVASRVAAPRGTAGASLARRVPLRILVVDDHEVNRRGRRGGGASGAAGTAAASSGTPLMNWSRLEDIRKYDDKRGSLVRKLVRSFVREGGARIDAIGRAARRGDATLFAATAHALKGAALNVGAAALAELCAALEAAGREGRMDRAVADAELLGPRFKETAKLLEKSLPAPARRKGRTSATRRMLKRKRGEAARRNR